MKLPKITKTANLKVNDLLKIWVFFPDLSLNSRSIPNSIFPHWPVAGFSKFRMNYVAVSWFCNSYKFCNGLSAISEAFKFVHFVAKDGGDRPQLCYAICRCICEVNKYSPKWITNAIFQQITLLVLSCYNKKYIKCMSLFLIEWLLNFLTLPFKNLGADAQNYCGTLANSCCRDWTYGTLAQIMQCTELSPLRFVLLKVP